MRQLLISFLFLVLGVRELSAQRWEAGIYHQRVSTSDTLGGGERFANNYIDLWSYVGKSQRVGVWGFVYEESGYYSATGGLFLDLTNWFELGLGGGTEFLPEEKLSRSRYAGFVLLFSGRKCTLEGYYENGQSRESWYQGDFLCRPIDGLGLGVFSQRFVGTGPRILLTLTDKAPLQLWVSPFMYDFESKGSSQALGFQLVFRGKK